MGRARHLRGFGAKMYNSVRIRSYNALMRNPEDNKMFNGPGVRQPSAKQLKQRRKTEAIVGRGLTIQQWEKEERDMEDRHKQAVDRSKKSNPNRR